MVRVEQAYKKLCFGCTVVLPIRSVADSCNLALASSLDVHMFQTRIVAGCFACSLMALQNFHLLQHCITYRAVYY